MCTSSCNILISLSNVSPRSSKFINCPLNINRIFGYLFLENGIFYNSNIIVTVHTRLIVFTAYRGEILHQSQRHSTHPLLGVTQEHQATQPQHICRGPRSYTYKLPDFIYNLCESLGTPLSLRVDYMLNSR